MPITHKLSSLLCKHCGQPGCPHFIDGSSRFEINALLDNDEDVEVQKYNEDQPRDENGRFASGQSSESSTRSPHYTEPPAVTRDANGNLTPESLAQYRTWTESLNPVQRAMIDWVNGNAALTNNVRANSASAYEYDKRNEIVRNEIVTNGRSNPDLWRGIKSSSDGLREGQRVHETSEIISWTTDRATAERFAGQFGQVFHMPAGATTAISLQDYKPDFAGENEWLTIGNAGAQVAKLFKYNEDEERDSHGRWSSSDGGSKQGKDFKVGDTITYGKHGDISITGVKEDKSPNYVQLSGVKADGSKVRVAVSREKSYPHKSANAQETPSSKVESPKASSALPSYEELSNMKRITGPLGSNGGVWRQDSNGDTYLVKPVRNEKQGYNEVAAGAVYRVAGITFPTTGVVRDNQGRMYVVSKKIEGLTMHNASWWQAHPSTQAKAAEGFGVDALLSHWDVHGLSGDNTLVASDGSPVRIESGGAMAYRAMGGVKDNFTPTGSWVEPSTMRVSAQGRAMYGAMTDAQAASSLEAAGRIDLNAVQSAWTAAGVPQSVSDPWMQTLQARQAQIPALVAQLRSSTKAITSRLIALSTISA